MARPASGISRSGSAASASPIRAFTTMRYADSRAATSHPGISSGFGWGLNTRLSSTRFFHSSTRPSSRMRFCRAAYSEGMRNRRATTGKINTQTSVNVRGASRLRDRVEVDLRDDLVPGVVGMHVVRHVVGEAPSLALEAGVQVGEHHALVHGQRADPQVHLLHPVVP